MDMKQVSTLYKIIQLTESGHDPFTSEVVLLEDRMDFLRGKYEGKLNANHDQYAEHKTSSAILNHLRDNDPSKRGVYTDWLAKHYMPNETGGGGFKQEDAYRIGDALKIFHKAKESGLLKKEGVATDINKYTPDSLKEAMKKYKETPITNKEIKADENEKGRSLLYKSDDGDFKAYRLEPTEEGKAASINIYGGGADGGKTHGTDWCTAADSKDNNFDTYSKNSPLYVFHHTADDGKEHTYQAHVHSNSFMDKEDSAITKDQLMQPGKHGKPFNEHLQNFFDTEHGKNMLNEK
jgi:hypothetical protein